MNILFLFATSVMAVTSAHIPAVKEDVGNCPKEELYQIWIALQFELPALRDNRKLVLAASRQNGKALQFVSDRLRDDREVVLAACNQYGKALQFYRIG